MEQALIAIRDFLLRAEAQNELVATHIDAAGLAADDPIRRSQARVTLNLNQLHIACAQAVELHGPAIGLSSGEIANIIGPKTPPSDD